MKAIENKNDIALLVNTFYTKVLANEKLAPFFKHLDFDKHLPKMIHFWSFILIDEPGYTTNITEKHANMKLTPELFDTWIALFSETVDSLFEGEKAEMAKQRASLLSWTMKSKL